MCVKIYIIYVKRSWNFNIVLCFFRLKSQKEFLIKFDSEPERVQWMKDLVRAWQEAQKLLKVIYTTFIPEIPDFSWFFGETNWGIFSGISGGLFMEDFFV